jgi:hypothetical protein
VFARYGKEAASDRTYVNECYELVKSKMQQELDILIQQASH